MRIGIDARLTYYHAGGGISTYIRNLIANLQRFAPAHISIFQSRKDPLPLSSIFARRNLWTPAHHPLERVALSAELAWRGLDIWHSTDFIPPIYGGRKHVITVHDLTFLHYPQYLTEDSRRYYNEQIEVACQSADAILAVSDATKQDIIRILGITPDKIVLQPHGVNKAYHPIPQNKITPVLQATQLPCDGYLLHVGTLEPRKNIIGLLRAYHKLLQIHSDAPPLVLVGREGWLFEETEAVIAQLKLGEKLIRRENISDTQLPAVYNGAIALISPSFYEGFGMPALEAMACGTVTIVSNTSSLPEVVGDVGLLIDPENIDTITDAMRRVIDDAPWRKQEEKRAIIRANEFSWEKSAQIAMSTYESLR